MLVETLMLASAASVLALVLAHAAMRALASWGPREVMWIDSLHIDAWAIGFAVLLAFAVTLTAGLVPALRLSGLGLQSPGHRTMTADRSQRHLRSALVIAEVAMALMLVSGTGLLLRSFVNLLNVDTGFRRDHVMVMQMFAWDRNPGPVALRSFLDRVTAKVASIPGVEQVGAVQAMPFIESNIDIQAQMRLVDQPPPKPGEEIRASYNVASPSYFAVMDMRPIKGRLLDDRDGPTSPQGRRRQRSFRGALPAQHRSDRTTPRDPRARQAGPDWRLSAWCRRCGTSAWTMRRAPKCCSRSRSRRPARSPSSPAPASIRRR